MFKKEIRRQSFYSASLAALHLKNMTLRPSTNTRFQKEIKTINLCAIELLLGYNFPYCPFLLKLFGYLKYTTNKVILIYFNTEF